MIDTSLTLLNAIQRCLSELNRSPHTIRDYRSTLKHFANDYLQANENTLMMDIDFDQFIGYPAWLAQRGLKNASIRAYLAAVKYFLNWLIIPKYIEADQSQMSRFEQAIHIAVAKHESRLPKIPRDDAVDEMIKWAKESEVWEPIRSRNIAMIYVLAHSGLRIGELVALKVEDIDFEERTIRVLAGKGDADRNAELSTETMAALLEYWQMRRWSEPSDPAFARHDKKVSKRHVAITSTNARAALKKVGDINPHAFRHWFATTMLEATEDITIVQKSLGHKNVATTLIYAKVKDSRVKDAHRKVFG